MINHREVLVMNIAIVLRANTKWIAGAIVLAVVAVVVGLNWSRSRSVLGELTRRSDAMTKVEPLVELVTDQTVRLTKNDSARILGLRLAEVIPAPPPMPLRLPGTLSLDPNRLMHVHSRLGGESGAIGQVEDENGNPRPLR